MCSLILSRKHPNSLLPNANRCPENTPTTCFPMQTSTHGKNTLLHSNSFILRLSTWRQSPFSIFHSQTDHMKTVSILNSSFSDCPHEDSLHSQFAILRHSTWRKCLFSIRHSQANVTQTVSILNSLFSDSQHEDSLHSQFAILILLACRQSNFRRWLSGKSRSLFGTVPRLQCTSFAILNSVTPGTLPFSILTICHLMGCLCSRITTNPLPFAG